MKNVNFRNVKVFFVDDSGKNEKLVILKDEDSFNEGDSVIVLDIKEYEEITSKLADSENKYEKLQKELVEEKNKIIDSKDDIKKLQDKINKIDNERIAIYKELDYKNKMILAYNVEMNKSIFNAIENVIDEAQRNINERNLELVSEINKNIEKTKTEVNERNRVIAYNINKTVEETNDEIRKTSLLKMLLYKNKINLKVPTNDIIKPFEFNFDPNELLSSKNLQLDTNEIIKNIIPKLPKSFPKYIESLDDKDD